MKNLIYQESEFLLYTSSDGNVHIDVLFNDDTIWLTQKRMATLFDVDVRTISEHLQNIFKIKELSADSVIRNFRTTASDGKNYNIQYYNLDAIISVGYRVNSDKATKFRIWATQILSGFVLKGYALDSERLKNGTHFGKDYFDQLLAEIREIRASERRFYQKITDIYATSADYKVDDEITKKFFATVQNKLHYAIHGNTAAELIIDRADSTKENMGLATWAKAPTGKILETDVAVAKNYLSKEELDSLNRFVTMYLDYAEDQARKGVIMNMEDWSNKLNAFLKFNDREVLDNPGKVSAEVAKSFAETEFQKFRVIQDKEFSSDFDELSKRYLNNKKENN